MVYFLTFAIKLNPSNGSVNIHLPCLGHGFHASIQLGGIKWLRLINVVFRLIQTTLSIGGLYNLYNIQICVSCSDLKRKQKSIQLVSLLNVKKIYTSVKTEKNRSLSSNLPGFPRLQLASVKTESQFGVDYFSKKSSF